MTADYITVPIDHMITVSPEHLDIGREQLVLLSPSQCAAEHETTVITNAAAYFYKLKDNTTKEWVCRDLTSLQPESSNTVEGRMVTGSASYWDHSAY